MNLQSYQVYTIKQILDLCGVTIEQSTDRRPYKIGGIGFDDPNETIRVVGEQLEVTKDSEVIATFTIV